MAMPKVLDWLDDLVAQVATNITNIAKNKSDITANKALFDTHTADDDRHWTTEDRENFDRTIHFKGYFITVEKLREAYPTGQLGDYAIVGGSDTVWVWDDETNSWVNSTEQGIVISVNGKTGEIILSKTDVGLSNVDNTSDANKPISTAQQTAFDAKADRRQITLAEADSLNLEAGIYDLHNVSKTILGLTASYWTVIVGDNSSNKAVTQIWMNYVSVQEPHIYIRHQVNNTSWSDFQEIWTSSNITPDELSLFRQYKGFFGNIGDLQVAFPVAKDGDYAIVGSALYIWNSIDQDWTEVSGSGGGGGGESLGSGKWSAKQYLAPTWTATGIRHIKDVQGLELEEQWEIKDTSDFLLTDTVSGYRAIVLETFVNMIDAATIITSSLSHDDSMSFYINGKLIFEQDTTAGSQTVSMNLVKGWNKIQIVLREVSGKGLFKLGVKITGNADCSSIDCFHNYDTVVDNAYVPLNGNSTISGNLGANSFIGSLTGNADTATKLKTARTINGVAFDGTNNITISNETVLGIQNHAAYHNSIYRGKDLTNIYTIAQISAKVSEGTFEDLYVGDYITVSINGTNRKLYFAGFDLYLNTGDTTVLTDHHIVIVTDILASEKMNDTDTTVGGYVGSKMYTTTLPIYSSYISDAIGTAHLIAYRQLQTNLVEYDVSNNATWVNCTLSLMSEVNVFGSTVFGSSRYDVGIDSRQFPLFILNPSFMNDARTWSWLKAVNSVTYFCCVAGYGHPNRNNPSIAGGLRPFFLFK